MLTRTVETRGDQSLIFNPIVADINDMIGREVDVYWAKGELSRSDFQTVISVTGTLERHPDVEQFRIFKDPHHAYFEVDDVLCVGGPLSSGRYFIVLK